MTKRFLVCLIALFCLASAKTSIAQDACQYIVDGTTSYNLLDFANVEPQTLTYTAGSFEYEFTFHLCNRLVPSCSIQGSQTQDTLVNAIIQHDKLEETCANVTGPKDHPVPSFLNQANSTEGVIISYPQHKSLGKASTFIAMITCDPTIPAKQIDWEITVLSEIDHSGETFIIQGKGAPGCPTVTLEGLIQFFRDNKYLFAVIYFVMGLFALLAGHRFFNVTIYFLVTFGVALGLTVVLFQISKVGETGTGRWFTFIICVLLGLACGYLAVKVEKIGFFALGSVLGGVGAMFLHTLLLHSLVSPALLIVLVVLFALIGGSITLWLWKDIIILATSLNGSYFLVRGASIFIGGFPPEYEIARGTADFDSNAYLYLLAMVVVAIGGIVYQFKKKKAMEDNEAEYFREPSIAKF